MKVMVSYIRETPGGNEKYTIELIKYLDDLDTVDLVVICSSEKEEFCKSLVNGSMVYAVKILRYPLSLFQERFFIKRFIALESPDVFHSPATLLPFWTPSCRSIVTVHDLNFLTLKLGVLKTVYKRFLYSYASTHADVLVCISEYTSNVLQSAYPASKGKVKVIWQGYNPDEYCGNDVTEKPIGKPYIVSFGHWAHKNVEDSVRIVAKMLDHGRPLYLKVLGSGGYIDDGVKPFVEALGVQDYVEYMGRVTDEELDILLRSSNALVFLSKYEGFGLPILEAMSKSCPVISSDKASLPEIVGDFGYIMKEDDISGATSYLCRLLDEPIFNEDVKRRGLEYASKLTWKRCFDELVKTVYS